MEQKISYYFEKLDGYAGRLLPDSFVNGSLRLVFSKTSVLIHTAWFIWWFVGGLNVGLLTNIVSLEAIYIGILIGIQQLRHHVALKKQLAKTTNGCPLCVHAVRPLTTCAYCLINYCKEHIAKSSHNCRESHVS